MPNLMKKEVIFVILVILLAGFVFAQPASPGLPSFRSSNATSASTTPATTPAPVITPTTPPPTEPVSPESSQPELAPQENITEASATGKSQFILSLFYIIIIIIFILAIIGFIIFLFLKYNTKKVIQIPDNIKIYVQTNLQRGYSEEQIKQQLSITGWSPEQINQIFKEIQHGF